MVESAKLHIDGPYDEDGNATGPTEHLYLAEDAADEAETDTNSRNAPTRDDDEAILAPLTGRNTVRYSGVINPERVRLGGYGSTQTDALQQYLFHLESLVLEEQGIGYKVTDDVRGKVYDPTASERGMLFDSVRWEFSNEEAPRGEWSLDGKVVEGVNFAESRRNKVGEEKGRRTTISDDKIETDSVSIPLGEVDTRRYEREIDLNVMEMVHESDQENLGSMESAVQGEFTMEGRIADRQVTPDLWTLSRQIVDDLHGVEARIFDSLSERKFIGAVSSSSTTINAGETDVLDYRISLDIGGEIAG